MAKLTDDERKQLAEHDEKIKAAIASADIHALDALHEREDIKKLQARERYYLADETVRGLWEKHKGEHVVFRVCRSIVKLMLYSSDTQAEAMQKRVQEIQKLINRVAELEAAAIRYAGTHETDKAYGQGQAVTHRNSLWICQRATCDRPGESDSWKMMSRGAQR